MTQREKVIRMRTTLRQIRDVVWEATEESDRNPNKGDLQRISRLAADALRETK